VTVLKPYDGRSAIEVTGEPSGRDRRNQGAKIPDGLWLPDRAAGFYRTNRLFALTNNSTITSNGTGSLAFTGTGDIAYTNTGTTPSVGRVLTLGGTNTGGNSFRPNLVDGTSPSGLTKAGDGSWIVSGNNTYTGGTTISGGTLGFGSTTALGTGTVTFSSNATLRATVSGTLSNTMSTGESSAVTATVDTEANEVTLSGSIAGEGNLTKTGAGTLSLTAENTYAGVTTVSDGVLAISAGGTTGSLAGDIVNSATVLVNRSDAVTLAGVISGSGTVTKQGAGNLILTGPSTYTGATSVSAGRLSVNGALGDSPVAVLAAAELGGSGSIGGAVSVATGGTLSPGNSIESLGTGSVTFDSGATFAYEVNSSLLGSLGIAADLLVVNGNLDIASGSLLTLTDLASTPNPFIEDTTIFALINYSGSWDGGLFTYGGLPLADGSMFTVGSQRWVIDYNSPTGGLNFTADYLPSGSFVTITAVPEPSTYAMALASLACGGYSMWRRRKRA
jgi:fibronectin-binding autotransporter adhesin